MIDPYMITLYDIASARVYDDEILIHYLDILIEYDWDQGDAHYEWVANAPIGYILDWCEKIRFLEMQLVLLHFRYG